MKKIELFQTSDGELFTSENAARWHQCDLDMVMKANELLAEGKSIGEILDLVKYIGPSDDILYQVTKDSKLSIGHWQCIDKPGYKVIRFEMNMRVFIHGDVGSWSGPCGYTESINALVRYAEHEKSKL